MIIAVLTTSSFCFILNFRYKIDRFEERKKLVIDLELKICLEKEACSETVKLFDQQQISQPLCDMEMKGKLLGTCTDLFLTIFGY